MINAILTLLLIILFFALGHITQAMRKLIQLITKGFLFLLSILGIKLINREKSIESSIYFKETYKDIKMIKLSKKNLKQKSSIHWTYLTLFLVSLTLVLLNLNSISGNAISNWLFTLIKPIGIINSTTDMNTFYVAGLFSILSFSLGKILSRWKDTKQQRMEKKELKIKEKALKLMTSKELVNYAKEKDEEKYKELK